MEKVCKVDRAECGEYIRSHPAYAGCTKDIFTETAIDKVYQISAGVPRIINRVCEKALMYAYQKQNRLIDDHMIVFVAEHEMLAGNEK